MIGTDLIASSLWPVLCLIITASVVLLLDVSPWRGFSKVLSLVGVIISLFLSFGLLGKDLSSFGGRFVVDNLSLSFYITILVGTALALLISFDFLAKHKLPEGEYYPLMLLATSGAMVMASARDLIVLILGLEIMSLAVYVLATWRQEEETSEEAGMKYFLLGAFASAFFIYGIALVYGATGSFSYQAILSAISAESFQSGLLASLGALFILSAFGFKVALVPFHQWAPDVYTGAPTSVTAFMSVVVKAGAFAAFLPFAMLALPQLSPALLQILSFLIAATLIIANFSALMQRSVKRMLAYSAVAHAGYLAMALLAQPDIASKAVSWYMLAYTLMTLGAFAILALLGEGEDNYESFAGLYHTRPFLAVAMTVFMLSLAGIPPFAGFYAKLLVFQAAVSGGYAWLAVLGIITSIIALLYYVRVVMSIFFNDSARRLTPVTRPASLIALGIALLGTILLGLAPQLWYQFLTKAAVLAGL
ncbi:MAG: NADH-quinone oxidoreductase subunit N [Deinococcales bacterium]